MQSDLIEHQNKPQSAQWFDDTPTHSALINTLPGLVSCPTTRCVLGGWNSTGRAQGWVAAAAPLGPLRRSPLAGPLIFPHYRLISGSREKVHGTPPLWKSEMRSVIMWFALKGKHMSLEHVSAGLPHLEGTPNKLSLTPKILPGQQKTRGKILKRGE